jgi:hypothetical protein
VQFREGVGKVLRHATRTRTPIEIAMHGSAVIGVRIRGRVLHALVPRAGTGLIMALLGIALCATVIGVILGIPVIAYGIMQSMRELRTLCELREAWAMARPSRTRDTEARCS